MFVKYNHKLENPFECQLKNQGRLKKKMKKQKKKKMLGIYLQQSNYSNHKNQIFLIEKV